MIHVSHHRHHRGTWDPAGTAVLSAPVIGRHLALLHVTTKFLGMEEWQKGRKGERERGRKGERERGRKGGRERGRKGKRRCCVLRRVLVKERVGALVRGLHMRLNRAFRSHVRFYVCIYFRPPGFMKTMNHMSRHKVYLRYMYTFLHVDIHACIHIHTQGFICACAYTQVHTSTPVSKHVYESHQCNKFGSIHRQKSIWTRLNLPESCQCRLDSWQLLSQQPCQLAHCDSSGQL